MQRAYHQERRSTWERNGVGEVNCVEGVKRSRRHPRGWFVRANRWLQLGPGQAGQPGLTSWVLLVVGAMTACSSLPRMPAPPVRIADVAPNGFPVTVRFLGSDREFVETHAIEKLARLRAAAGGHSLTVLALSGGGAGGAFGAGALVGLSRCGERPRFDVVTGVSAGALIAPFAFLGPGWDGELKDAFLSGRAEHLLQPRGVDFLFRPGYFKGEPLAQLVNHFATERLVEEVARQAAEGRLLLVATTDLDKEESVIWNLGAVAAQGGERAVSLFRAVLIASASIPGVFPPVLIRVEGNGGQFEEMHVDGGTTLPLFVAPEIAEAEPLLAKDLEGASIYILVNGQLNTYPATTRTRPVPVLSRSLSTALTHSSRKALAMAAFFAERHGMPLRFSYIPVTFPYQGSLDFKPSSMRALFEYGARCAEAGVLWTTAAQAIENEQRIATSPPRQDELCPGVATLEIDPTRSLDSGIQP